MVHSRGLPEPDQVRAFILAKMRGVEDPVRVTLDMTFEMFDRANKHKRARRGR